MARGSGRGRPSGGFARQHAYQVRAATSAPEPLPVFGKAFRAGRGMVKARLHMTGLGMYSAELNGRPLSEAVLEPGQTSYQEEVDYRTYDIG